MDLSFLPLLIISNADIVARAAADIAPMATKKKVTISWSGGKDSAFALRGILQSKEFEVVELHTVINMSNGRVGMHGIRQELIGQQADALGIPLSKIYVEESESHGVYERAVGEYYQRCRERQIQGVVFGDIFLEDLKSYRENLLRNFALQGIFPLWKMNTEVLIGEFIDAGFKTLICAADTRYFTTHDVGKTIDKKFIKNLVRKVDPCGENGEFHTFVYDAPYFKYPIRFQFGEVVKKSYHYETKNEDGSHQQLRSEYWFQDLLTLTP